MCTNAAIFEYQEQIDTLNSTKEGEGAFLSSDEVDPRIFSNLPKDSPTEQSILKEDEWCHYGGLPSPKAYMD